jgi:hypothetical protein
MLKGYNDGVALYTVKVGMLLVSFFLEESAKSVKLYDELLVGMNTMKWGCANMG